MSQIGHSTWLLGSLSRLKEAGEGGQDLVGLGLGGGLEEEEIGSFTGRVGGGLEKAERGRFTGRIGGGLEKSEIGSFTGMIGRGLEKVTGCPPGGGGGLEERAAVVGAA